MTEKKALELYNRAEELFKELENYKLVAERMGLSYNSLRGLQQRIRKGGSYGRKN